MANIYHAACWLLAGSVAAPVWSQSAIDPDQPSTPSHPEIEAVAPSGERAPELVDALIEVSDQYQNEGQHFLADAAIERALEITRINYGLYSLEQIPLIQRSIDNESARDNPVGVWDREQQLIELADRNPDDPRIVPILTEMAGKRVDILERYLEGEYPPEIVLGCYYRRGNHNYSGCTGGSSRVVSETLFFEALRYYDDAIGTLVRNEAQSSPERLQLEQAALQMIYEFADLIFPPSRYELGKDRLERLYNYHAKHSDLLTEIDALVQLADWELLYANYSNARDVYSRAYQRLVDEGVARESIDAIFAPSLPVVIPASESNWLESDASPPAEFIDVDFEINRYGKSKRVDILDSSTNESKDTRNRVEHMIATSRFRPLSMDGRFDDAASVSIRYYVDE